MSLPKESWSKRRPVYVVSPLEFLFHLPHEPVESALHRNHLLTHVKGDFYALPIDPHFVQEYPGHTDPIDLIDRIQLLDALHDGMNHGLFFQTENKLFVNVTNLDDFVDSQILPRHEHLPGSTSGRRSDISV